MIKLLQVLLLLTFLSANAQIKRIQIRGTLITKDNTNIQGVSVFNTKTMNATVTSDKGIFYIDVAVGDQLAFNSIALEDFFYTITAQNIENQNILINLTDRVNELETVKLNEYSESVLVRKKVNIDLNLGEIDNFKFKVKAVDRVEETFSGKIRQPEDYALVNKAQQQSQPSFYGAQVDILGVVIGGLMKLISGKKEQEKFGNFKNSRDPFFDIKDIKNKFDTRVLLDLTQIKEENLIDFLYFAQDNGVDQEYLDKTNELDLLDKLQKIAALYKKRKF